MKENKISVVSSAYKVRREQTKIEYKKKRADFLCAKNGHESLQLIISAAKKVAHFTVKISDFVGKNGVLDASLFELFIEHYAEVDRPTRNNRYIHPLGFYPDALIPYETALEYGENCVEKGDNQGIWICFSAPKEAKSGRYEGKIEVDLDGEFFGISASVQVLSCEVPDKVRMQTLFIMRERFIELGEGKMSEELIWKYFHFFLDYRINPYTFPVRTLEVNEFADCVEKYFDNPSLAGYGFPQQWGGGAGVFDFEKLKEQIRELARRSKRGRNLLDKAFIKNGDEPEDNKMIEKLIDYEHETKEVLTALADEINADTSGAYDAFKTNEGWYQSIAEMDVNVPFSQIWTTVEGVIDEDGLRSKMLKAVNTWCPKPNAFDLPYGTALHRLHDTLQPNRKLWWYICNDPVWPYPSYHIDDVLMGARVLSWMQYQHDVVGNLYWSPVCFSNKVRPVGRTKYDVPYRSGGVGCPSGEGFLVYPGSPYGHFGPLPSMRLMEIRGGMEDYELFLDYDQKITAFCKEVGAEDGDAKSVLNTYFDGVICGTQFYENVNTFDEARKNLLCDFANFDVSNVRVTKVEHTTAGGKVVCYTRKGATPQGDFQKTETVGEWSRFEGFVPYEEPKNYLTVKMQKGVYKLYLSTKRSLITDFSKEIPQKYIDVTEGGKVALENGKTELTCVIKKAVRDSQTFAGVYFDVKAFGKDELDLTGKRYLVLELKNPMPQTYNLELVLYAKDGFYSAGDMYFEHGETQKLYVRTDRIEWSKLNRITGIGLQFSYAFLEDGQTVTGILRELSVIE